MFAAFPRTVLPEVFMPELLAFFMHRKKPIILHSLKEIVDKAAAYLLPDGATQEEAGIFKIELYFNAEHLEPALKLPVDSWLPLARKRKAATLFLAAHFLLGHTRGRMPV